MTGRPDAHGLIDLVLDPGSWESWDTPPDRQGISPDYAETLARAEERSGVDEAVLTGCATVEGRRVAGVVGEFGYLAGSIGVETARRFVEEHRNWSSNISCYVPVYQRLTGKG